MLIRQTQYLQAQVLILVVGQIHRGGHQGQVGFAMEAVEGSIYARKVRRVEKELHQSVMDFFIP